MGDLARRCPHLRFVHLVAVQRTVQGHVDALRTRELRCCSCGYGLPDLWLCMAMGCQFVGCGRSSNQHMMRHSADCSYTGDHKLCMCLSSGEIWCYACNMEITDEVALAANVGQVWLNELQSVRQMILGARMDRWRDEEPTDVDLTGSRKDNNGKGLCGLTNQGNTCYMNAATQALSNCWPLTRFILKCEAFYDHWLAQSGRHRTLRGGLVHDYANVIRALWNGDRRAFSPQTLLQKMVHIHPPFRGYHQQDAQEYLRTLLDSLHEALKREVPQDDLPNGQESEGESNGGAGASRHHTSPIADIFGGKMRSDVACCCCNTLSSTTDEFFDISVSIPTKKERQRMHGDRPVGDKKEKSGGWFWSLIPFTGSGSQQMVTLEECLQSFCLPEILTGTEKYKCETCGGLTESHKKLSIVQLPEVLCIHIKRFRYDSYWGSKITTPIKFPLDDLNMDPFCKKLEGEWLGGVHYRLVAIVNHHGSFIGGHYTAMCQNHYDGAWYDFNDSAVSKISDLDKVRSAQAYLLFYERKSPAIIKERRHMKDLMRRKSARERPFLLSLLWYNRWKTMSHPGPMTWDFLCEHNQGILNLDKQGMVKTVPQCLWNELAKRYNGGQREGIRSLEECDRCREAMYQIDHRREQERLTIMREDSTQVAENEDWYIVDAHWIQRWREFAMQGGRDPGPISNNRLLRSDGRPLEGLVKARDYRGVNGRVWNTFVSFHGGGPPLIRRQIDIYTEPPRSVSLDGGEEWE